LSAEFRFKDFVGKRVLFKGEAGTGKTLLMRRLLAEAALALPKGSITLIDLAPPARSLGDIRIGGPIETGGWIGRINNMQPAGLRAPRLEGATREVVLTIAQENAKKIDPMLDRYLEKPTKVLFINDLTIYFHQGNFGRISKVAMVAETFIGNAYEGELLKEDHGSGITEREHFFLEDFEELMDVVLVKR
jgi:hypothetical protein